MVFLIKYNCACVGVNKLRGVAKLQTVQWSGYELNNPDFESGQGKDSFLFSETSRPTQ